MRAISAPLCYTAIILQGRTSEAGIPRWQLQMKRFVRPACPSSCRRCIVYHETNTVTLRLAFFGSDCLYSETVLQALLQSTHQVAVVLLPAVLACRAYLLTAAPSAAAAKCPGGREI